MGDDASQLEDGQYPETMGVPCRELLTELRGIFHLLDPQQMTDGECVTQTRAVMRSLKLWTDLYRRELEGSQPPTPES